MPSSDYVSRMRAVIGHDLLQLPAASAVIMDDAGRVLLASHRPSLRWSFIGGGVEPEESPQDGALRELREELGAEGEIIGLVGSYGGPAHTARYDNGDVVSYVVTVFLVRLVSPIGAIEEDELAEVRWFEPDEIRSLARPPWLDAVLGDALALKSALGERAAGAQPRE